ncbi:MAG: sulfurtransferase [Anaerolineales bacterium]|nr:sulfurtransferase [Anaerolineales bacterium]
MTFTTLISVEGLQQFYTRPDWVVMDCRFSLAEPERGRQAYQAGHIPGARYAHLDEHLSGPIVPGQTGRHPLPPIDVLAARLGAWGISADSQVVVYDDSGGDMAVRLWWLLQWLGHPAVAVLDGGFPAWEKAGLPVTTVLPDPAPVEFVPQVRSEMLVSAGQLLAEFGDPSYLVVDVRAAERYRGEVEPIDPVAGHIPGAVNYPYVNSIDRDGHFQLKQILRGRFENLFGPVPAKHVTFYCGSGVTGAHGVLAVAHAGLGMPRLYAGSWSHWIADPERPVARGG